MALQLPLLALGGAAAAAARAGLGAIARTTGAVAARTGAARTGAAGGAAGGATALGFADVMKRGSEQSPASNVINFKTANSTIGKSSGGAAAPIAHPTMTPTNSMSGDIAAASELSMEELANQTQILKAIQKNTGVTAKNTKVPPSAGGQAVPPPTEEEIKGKLDADEGSKLAKLVGKLEKGLSSSLGTAILALGAALAVNEPEDPEDKEKTTKTTDFELMTGTGEGAEKNIFGVEKGATRFGSDAKYFNLSQYRFTKDEKGNRVVGSAEQEANKEKKTQIMAMIGEGGDPADSQKLETAFRKGDVKSIQEIEDKYRKAGTEGSQAYQYRAAEKSFSQADAVSVAKREGIDTPDLINADQETKDKFIAEMYAKQNELAKNYSAAIAGEGKNYERRAELTGSRLDKVVESKFDAEGKGSFFGRSKEEGKAFDNIKAELEGYRKSLKSSGLGEKEANNRVADELKKLEKLSAEQMMDYTAPKVSGDALQGAQTQASTAEADAAARRATPPAPAPSPTSNKPAPESTNISTGITVNNKAHDDLATILKKLTGFV